MAIARAKESPKELPRLMPVKKRRVHGEEPSAPVVISFPQFCSPSPTCLTVWRRSLLFNGRGYTVYDSTGRLVFRVDNYASNWRQEIFLMDFAGNVLLSICRRFKKISILERWEAFRGDVFELNGPRKPLFTATKALSSHMIGNPSCNVLLTGEGDGQSLDYRMNWSREQGWSRIYRSTSGKLPVAEVNRKCGSTPEMLLDKDVFSLSMQPGIDQVFIMGLLIINHAMA